MQASTLHREAFQRGVFQGPAREAFRQQTRVAKVHHWRGGEHVAHFDYSVEQACLEGATELAEVTCRVTVAIDRQHVERAAPTATTIAAVEFEGQHGMGIDAKAEGALGVARLETCDERLGPGLGIARLAGG
ncbi:hypothetical protein D3C78_920340 [compost metagenome]